MGQCAWRLVAVEAHEEETGRIAGLHQRLQMGVATEAGEVVQHLVDLALHQAVGVEQGQQQGLLVGQIDAALLPQVEHRLILYALFHGVHEEGVHFRPHPGRRGGVGLVAHHQHVPQAGDGALRDQWQLLVAAEAEAFAGVFEQDDLVAVGQFGLQLARLGGDEPVFFR
jgi:hypothetical protein